MNKLDKMEAAMRYVYAHIIEDEDEIGDMISSQKKNIVSWRHILRERIYIRMAATLQQVGDAEGKICGSARDKTTIGTSVHKVRRGTFDPEAVHVINRLLDEFEDYWNGFGSIVVQHRIRFFNSFPAHVLATVLALATEFGYADPTKINGLIKEFRTQSKTFVQKVEKS